MNVRKAVDYGTMYRKLTAILAQNLPQMDEVYAISRAVSQRPEKGAAVAAAEFLQANFPDRTGFSPRNVRRMRDFYRTYENDQTLLRLAMKIGWTLNVVIMEAGLTRETRKWYLEQAQAQQWSKMVLLEKLASEAHLEKPLDEKPNTCYTEKKITDDSKRWRTKMICTFWKRICLIIQHKATGLFWRVPIQLILARNQWLLFARC
ncbi:MAG: DUF1016 N-terminal domain-containing protein [Oscillospiraceae bacterium]